MVSYKNLFLIKGMTCWNGVTDWFRRVRENVYAWYESAMGWFDPRRGSWYLTPGGVFPLSHYYRYGLDTKNVWRYQPETGELVYGEGPLEEKREYNVAWLSARVKKGSHSTDMDGFLGDLRIYPQGQDLPLSVLLQAWSLYDRHWWLADGSAKIEWIDRMAEEHRYAVTEPLSIPLLCRSGKN